MIYFSGFLESRFCLDVSWNLLWLMVYAKIWFRLASFYAPKEISLTPFCTAPSFFRQELFTSSSGRAADFDFWLQSTFSISSTSSPVMSFRVTSSFSIFSHFITSQSLPCVSFKVTKPLLRHPSSAVSSSFQPTSFTSPSF